MVSIIIARLLGPLLLVSAAAIVLNRKGIQKAAAGEAKDPAVVYLAGLITFLGGLAIVEFHNVWVAAWQTVITVFGWLMVVGGAARMLLPDQLATAGAKMARRDGALIVGAAFSAAVGIILTVKSF